jgi:hypothetical protein
VHGVGHFDKAFQQVYSDVFADAVFLTIVEPVSISIIEILSNPSPVSGSDSVQYCSHNGSKFGEERKWKKP